MRAPRALANSYSSSTTTPAPSPSTKPSRSRSQGREALCGSSLRVESARIAAKPPKPKGEMVASAPPATITSASPYSMIRPASPMLCKPVVQAVAIAKLGPLKPQRMETWPEIMLMMEAGTKNGEMRRGPRATSSSRMFSISGKPPMPEPIRQPMRYEVSSPRPWPSLHPPPLASQQPHRNG